MNGRIQSSSALMLNSCTDIVSRTRELRLEPSCSPLSLRANFGWTLAGNVVYTGCQWGILVVLAKLGTAEMLGQFALSLAIVSPILISSGLCLRNIQITEPPGTHNFSSYLSLRVLTTVLGLVVVVGVLFFCGYSARINAVILLIALAKGCESMSDIFYGLFQQHERMDRIAVSMMMKGVFSLAALGLGVLLARSLFSGVCGLLAVWAIVLFVYDARCGKSILRSACDSESRSQNSRVQRFFQWPLNATALFQLALLALPVGIAMALVSFNANIPRYFIEYHLGTAQLGIFAAMAYPMVAGATVVGALGQSATPRLSQYYASGERRAFLSLLLKLVSLASAVGLAAVLVIALAGRPILLLLYRPEYAEHVTAFLLLAIATALGYVASILGYGMTAARYFRAQLPVFMLTTAVTAAACALLVPRQQLPGAALAMSLATLCQGAASAAVIVHALKNGRIK